MTRRNRHAYGPPDPFDERLPVVAIVGRPNVGKSTLFNRLTGTRAAAVHDAPGVTRDRHFGIAEWTGSWFRLVDTGGFEDRDGVLPLISEVREQVMLAIEQSDVVLFVLDINDPNHPTDAMLTDILRRSNKPFVTAVNKCERHDRFMDAYGLAALGTGNVFPVSAQHGTGTGELLDKLVDLLPPMPEEEETDDDEGAADPPDPHARPIRLAIVGRQNVGKSTLVNRLLGEERVIASPLAGTTRDAIDTPFTSPDGQRWIIVDTAGIRRRGKIDRGIESLSVMSAMMSMERADVAILVLDATEGLADQDAHIAGYAVERGCCLIVAVNKWDAIEKDEKSVDRVTKALRAHLAFIDWAPVITLSALGGQRVAKLWETAATVYRDATTRLDTPSLNQWLTQATTKFSAPVRRNRQFKPNYIVQTGVLPPTFTIFCNDPALVHFSYQRYLVNSLREQFALTNVPLRLRLRKKNQGRGRGAAGGGSRSGGGGAGSGGSDSGGRSGERGAGGGKGARRAGQ